MTSPWPFGLYRVAGESMLPALAPGDLLLGWRWSRPRPRPGRVVVARGPAGRPLVKRVARLAAVPTPAAVDAPADGFWLLGDNAAASTDSRHFGVISGRDIEAAIIFRLKRA